MPTITVTAWHPYPQFSWQYKMVSGGGWATVDTNYGPYNRLGGTGPVNEKSLDIDDPETGDESSLRCIIGNPAATPEDMNPSDDTLAATVKASDPVHVTVNALTWNPNLESDKTITLEETISLPLGQIHRSADNRYYAANPSGDKACNLVYLRPYIGTPYGAGDGSTFYDALSDPSTINYKALPKDSTVFVCGTVDTTISGTPTTLDIQGQVTGGATVGSPLVIRGDSYHGIDEYGKPGFVFGTRMKWGDDVADGGGLSEGGAWTPTGEPGVYQTTYAGTYPAYQWLFEDGVHSAVRSEPPGGADDWTEAGPLHCHDFGNNTLYYKPSSGDPDNHVIHVDPYAISVNVRDINYVMLSHLEIRGYSSQGGAEGNVVFMQTENTDMYRCTTKYGQYMVTQREKSYYHTFIGNTLSEGRNGTYHISGVVKGYADNAYIADNEVFNIGADPNLDPGGFDYHGIALQGGDDVLIEHNHCYDTVGSGITQYVGTTGTARRNVIRYNYCHDMGPSFWNGNGTTPDRSRCIEFSTNNKYVLPDDVIDTKIYCNVVAKSEGAGIMYCDIGNLNEGNPTSMVRNNTAVDCEQAYMRRIKGMDESWGGAPEDNPTTVNFDHNVQFIGNVSLRCPNPLNSPTNRGVHWMEDANGSDYPSTFALSYLDQNVWYPKDDTDGSGYPTNRWRWAGEGGATYLYAEFKGHVEDDTDAGHEVNSVVADPLLMNDGNTDNITNFAPNNGSPCIGRVDGIEEIEYDILGRPMGIGMVDSGAIQYEAP